MIYDNIWLSIDISYVAFTGVYWLYTGATDIVISFTISFEPKTGLVSIKLSSQVGADLHNICTK